MDGCWHSICTQTDYREFCTTFKLSSSNLNSWILRADREQVSRCFFSPKGFQTMKYKCCGLDAGFRLFGLGAERAEAEGAANWFRFSTPRRADAPAQRRRGVRVLVLLGPEADTLISASTDLAEAVELHTRAWMTAA